MLRIAERADFLHCLAASFLAPPPELATREWCQALAGDLDDLGAALDIPVEGALTVLRETARGPLAGEPWLVEYSRLFLVPPVRVTLNAGVYLEGGLAGVSAQMIAQCYGRAGLECRPGLGDLPDHVATQLEFLAELHGRMALGDVDAGELARAFVSGFIDHWAEPLQKACTRASPDSRAACVYAELASLIGHASRS